MANTLVIDESVYPILELPNRPRAILDKHVAQIFAVETKRVNEAVKNNPQKFPDDFMYELNDEETKILKSKISTSNSREFNRGNPKAFTWEGCNMVATILKSDIAVKRCIFIIRTFTNLEKNYVHSHYQRDSVAKDYSQDLQQLKIQSLIRFSLLLEQDGDIKGAKIAMAYAAKESGMGEEARLLLPPMNKMYTPTEMASILGISSQKVGKWLKQLGLHGTQLEEMDANCEAFKDKSPHSNKEVVSFRYSKNVLDRLKHELKDNDKKR